MLLVINMKGTVVSRLLAHFEITPSPKAGNPAFTLILNPSSLLEAFEDNAYSDRIAAFTASVASDFQEVS